MIYCFCGSYDFFSTWHSSLALRKRTQKKSNGVGWWGGVMVRADGRHVALTSALLEHDGRRSTTKEPLLDGLFPLPSLGFPTGLLMAIDDGCRERIDGVAIVSAHRNATHFAPPPPPPHSNRRTDSRRKQVRQLSTQSHRPVNTQSTVGPFPYRGLPQSPNKGD